MVAKYYTGVGSRETPAEICKLFHWLGEAFANEGWTLRSGCAPGADTAFESGAKSAMARCPMPEFYLPWPGFEERGNDGWQYVTDPQPEALDIAAQFHPAWDRCKQGARKLHARNVHQVLGKDVTNPVLSKFLICWTPEASGSGGTGQALRIAKHYGVQIFDAGDAAVVSRLERWLG